ncbi:hypothetical protein CGZ93_02825 [Enemella dayhoffiae]|uniref:Carboxypeptidase regulatory-like domain-containing protein n=1 Tax=Enemella dayhoffiae TaxID=2016507 RepID=A0A255HA39_9ACTN|nr:hypothetical protein CGZ93_02825 [Enemella dayhoffiae]
MVSPTGNGFTVRGRLLDEARQPIVGAVGDFYLEGTTRNLVQSYSTGVDGGFSASFSNADAPAEATLMMHYRGDDQHAPSSFLIRRGVPRPTPSPTPTPTRTTPPPAAPATTPPPTAPAQPTPRFTGPGGAGGPAVTAMGNQLTVTGRLLGADGRPLAGAQVTAPGLAAPVGTGADGGFQLSVPMPGSRELTVTAPAAAGRPGASTKVTW